MSLTSNSVLIYLFALIPALGWVLVYRYLDNRDPEPLRPTSLAVMFGILSTVPVFLMQYLFAAYPDYNFVALLQHNISNPLLFSGAFLLFVALVEESVKIVAFIYITQKYRKAFNQVVDGIVYGALIGLGFAIAENVYYFSKALEVFDLSTGFLAVFSLRSFGTMLAHTLFTGIFGFYYARAYFAPFVDKNSRKEKLWQNLAYNLKHAIQLRATCLNLLPAVKNQKKTLSRNAMIFEGFIVAIVLHFLYNAFIKMEIFGRNWTFLIMPLIFILAWFAWSRFFMRVYNRILDFIGNHRGGYKIKIR